MARYVIRVLFPDGGVAWLRHGPVIGSGPIVRFPNKKTAEVNLDFIREGLDEGCVAQVVKVAAPQRIAPPADARAEQKTTSVEREGAEGRKG